MKMMTIENGSLVTMEFLLTVKGDSEQIHREYPEKTCLLKWKPARITHSTSIMIDYFVTFFFLLISSELSRFFFCLMQTAGVNGKEVLLKIQEDGKRIIWCISFLPGTGQSWLLPPAQGDMGACLPFWMFSTSALNLKLSVETKNKMLNKGDLQCEWSSKCNFKWKF